MRVHAWFLKRLVFMVLCMISPVLSAMTQDTSIAFYYGDEWPIEEFHAFNIVVVSPELQVNPMKFNSADSQLYAYVSVGEVDKKSAYSKKVKPEWMIGHNDQWDTSVMDLANPDWRRFIIQQLITPLWIQGYKGFFLDTLDSYQLTKKDPILQQEGLIALIKDIKQQYPQAKLILNRGFEVIPKVATLVDAVAAESMFSSWNPKKKHYQAVSENDRRWLDNTLQEIKAKYQLPIIVIDYLPPEDRRQAREIAQKIHGMGYTPWVTDQELSTIGIGLVEVIPRKIMVLLSPPMGGEELLEVAYHPLAFPLQYMGYVPEFYFVNKPLPTKIMAGRYAGIITEFDEPEVGNAKAVDKFLSKQMRMGIPIVLLNYLGLPNNSSFLSDFGIYPEIEKIPSKQLSIDFVSPMMGYELLPKPNLLNFFPLKTGANSKTLITIKGENQHIQEAAAITPYGGYALAPYGLAILPEGKSKWVVNPFQFFKEALRLPDIPVPDVTTANGRRILTAHIDGDAFISRIPWKSDAYAGDLIFDEILNKYQIPTTVSFIQREFELVKVNDKAYEHLINLGRNIFALPWVDIATHTYSHPLMWGKLVEGEENKPYLSYPDKQYKFSYEKEIAGSTAFINQELAPSNKRLRMVLWSGDALVGSEPLAITAHLGLFNINGFASVYLANDLSLTNLSSLGQTVNGYYHVFSPIANDFIYTDNWSQPLYKYMNVIDTFKLTETPHRYKPISVYYHFYSALDQGAFHALQQIYQWVIQQKTTPIQVVDYAQKVLAFNHLLFARPLAGGWLILNNKQLREFRIPDTWDMPLISLNNNILGFNKANHDYYIHLSNGSRSFIQYNQPPSSEPFIEDANADHVVLHKTGENQYHLDFDGYVPFEFQLGNANKCQVIFDKKSLTPINTLYKLPSTLSGHLQIQCN